MAPMSPVMSPVCPRSPKRNTAGCGFIWGFGGNPAWPARSPAVGRKPLIYRGFKWSGRGDLNSRLAAWEGLSVNP